ncbi:arylamine N-acetyltransferase [Streptomyces rubiginosohelvolus]|uniref:arylamine N-acetyltransferase family protein n=1 Tax=Streptomyces rubiginosohelvolus TaxID=67362 RepID=UPI0016797391|nr:arylamine N-acetyltransferase [Streptomyces rubiginosohelvolus]GGS25712.1 arylamine N-acetyltransferase [Streptomyces rubiginosohelvolus]
MTLDAMLRRIGYRGRITPDLEMLFALHRCWRRTVPYENLDIQLGRPISLDPDVLSDKLIRRRRGGFCYEQNAGLAMLLRLSGFEVSMVEGGVMRQAHGNAMWGNHTALIIDLDGRQWVADAGIGDGFMEPLHLREGTQKQGSFTYRLERLDPQTWRFHHHPGATIASYDFRLQPCEPADFAARSQELSTAPVSPYVTTLITARPVAGHTLLLLSRTVRQYSADGRSARTIEDVGEFAATLREKLLVPLEDLGPDGVGRLWERARAQDDLWRTRAQESG